MWFWSSTSNMAQYLCLSSWGYVVWEGRNQGGWYPGRWRVGCFVGGKVATEYLSKMFLEQLTVVPRPIVLA